MSGDQATHEITPDGWWLVGPLGPHDGATCLTTNADDKGVTFTTNVDVFRRGTISLFLPVGQQPGTNMGCPR